MILSGQTIRRYAADGMLVTPFCERTKFGGMTYGVGPAGYDVRAEFDDRGTRPCLVMGSGQFALAATIERFKMPPNIIGMVHDKSSWARRGITVQNTVIEPGWEGFLTIELVNHSDNLIRIERGMPIAQIVFHVVDEAVDFPYDTTGKYQNQGRGPREAK